MNNQIGLTLIVVVLIIIAFLAGGIFTRKYFSAPKKEETGIPKEEEIPPLSNTAECKSVMPIKEIVTGSFRSIDEFTSAGEVTLSGYVVTKKGRIF